MRWAATILAAALAAIPSLRAQTSPAPVPPSGAAELEHSLQSSIADLQSAVTAFDPESLQVSKRQQQSLADGQASLARNLSDAVPGLLAAFRAAPDDMGAAFRLYRDLDAVLGVAQRSADAGASDLAPPTDELRASLSQLGNWIESRGSADYATLRQLQAAAAAAPPAQAAAPPPPPLIINDANAPTPAKKKPAKPAPKPCCS